MTLSLVTLPQYWPEVTAGTFERAATGELSLPGGYVATALLVPGDLDGDGADDLYLVRAPPRDCGFEPRVTVLETLSGARFPVAAGEVVRGATLLDLAGAEGRERLLRAYLEPWGGTCAVEVRAPGTETLLWSLPANTSPVGRAFVACFLPALDPGGVPDVIVANAWAAGEESPAVAKLSGVDGTTAWVRPAHASGQACGRFVAAAGDHDGDGWNDVVVCVPELAPTDADPERRLPHLEYLSGADGTLIRRRSLEPARLEEFRAVGDLDGDDRTDFVVQYAEPARGDGPPTWLLLSSLDEPLHVLPESEVEWFTPWRDEAGAKTLLVGARERAATESGMPGANNLWIVSPKGSARFAQYPAGLSWRVDEVAAGDFDGDGRMDLAVVQRGSRERVGYRQHLSVVPGSGLR